MFDITACELQSDILAPFLFIIVLDHAMRQTILESVEELGFTIHHRKSRRHPKVALTDLDFADDISLLTGEIEQAQKLLECVERECKKVGLIINAKKKCLSINFSPPGSQWYVSHRSSLYSELKVRFFRGTVAPILLYGCKAWALTQAMEHSLDRTYTRMLCMVLNIHWSSHTSINVW
jgi:hypothetical protein